MQIPPFSLNDQISEIGEEVEEAIIKVFRSGKYIGGEVVNKFEEAFASEIQTSFAVGCNSGTDALILALRALNNVEGEEVIAAASVGVKHRLVEEFQVEPGALSTADQLKDFGKRHYIFHYTYGIEYTMAGKPQVTEQRSAAAHITPHPLFTPPSPPP